MRLFGLASLLTLVLFGALFGVAEASEHLAPTRMGGVPLSVTYPPPGGATIIDFDDISAPCALGATTALRDGYANLGVRFTGPNVLDGAAILNECADLGISDHSSPNLLVLNSAGVLADGGRARPPLTVHFDPPATYVQVNVGSSIRGWVWLETFDPDNVPAGASRMFAIERMSTMAFETGSQPIAKLVIRPDDGKLVVDDLAFIARVVDEDGDGLPYYEEEAIGTDPRNPDTDGDGLLDGFEVHHLFDPLFPGEEVLDNDADGLDNLAEQAAGTDPRDSDTDDDRLADGTEVTETGTDPLDPDSDDDGLADGTEIDVVGTDPRDADSDDDGLRDGFEVQHQFDPLTPGEGGLDPDLDGLDNISEQAAGTDPRDTDTDDDGLQDGHEVSVLGTNPADTDTDDDGLNDGAELLTYGTDPLTSDTDGGGVGDGDEILRGTDPLNPADDLASFGLVLDSSTRSAVTLDPTVPVLRGSIQLGTGSPNDCVILPDGLLAFASTSGFTSEVRVLELGVEPGLATGINAISTSNSVSDLALSADARFILACETQNLVAGSVIDVEAREEVGTFFAGDGSCNSVDVCRDGTVLVTSSHTRRVHRLMLDADGNVTDSNVSLALPPISSPRNVACAPNSQSGVVVDSMGQVHSFLLPGLTPVSTRPLSKMDGMSAVFSLDGERLYVRAAVGSLDVFDYDPATARMSLAPLYSRTIPLVGGRTGVEQMALDPAESKLFVPRPGGVDVLAPNDGAPLASLVHSSVVQSSGICFRAVIDTDGDGLANEREYALGTDLQDPDTDDDGLRDGFEVRHGFDPLQPGDQSGDPDQDGLSNVGEQSARTNPHDNDSDNDGLNDGNEVIAGTDPHVADTDQDDVLDGADNCPALPNPEQADVVHPNGIGDACDDPDDDLLPDAGDNCPDATNSDQGDAEGDGLGDACDPYPTRSLRVRPVTAALALTHRPLPVTYRLEDVQTGQLVTDLPGVRTTVTTSGSSVFGSVATEGILVSGGGTNRILVEFESGVAALTVHDLEQEWIVLDGEDTERNGVKVLTEYLDDFELGNGGFTSSGEPIGSVWEWGVPTFGPGAAASGQRVWATNLDGPYFGSVLELVSPPIRLTGAHPRLEFQSWFSAEACCDRGRVQVNAHGFWEDLELLTGFQGGYSLKTHSLESSASHIVRVRFRLENNGTGINPGWFIDDFRITDVPTSVEFVLAGGDLDDDGLTNEQEILLGTDPHQRDTDGDFWADGHDNCPLIRNENQYDHVHPDGAGDVCDDPDGDGVVDATDNCPDLGGVSQADSDDDGAGDSCDFCPAEPHSLACLTVTEDGGSCLESTIGLSRPDIDGSVVVFKETVTVPTSLRFEVLEGGCASGDGFEFSLNGHLLGSLAAANLCQCAVAPQSFVFSDRDLLAEWWVRGGTNVFGFRKAARLAAIGWVRVVVQKQARSEAVCLLDVAGSACADRDLCSTPVTIEPFEISVPALDQLIDLVPSGGAAFTDSELPGRIGLSALEDGDYQLCVDVKEHGLLYVADYHRTLARIDLETARVVGVVGQLPLDPNEIEFNRSTGRAFVQGLDRIGQEFDIRTAQGIGSAVSTARTFTGMEWIGSNLYGSSVPLFFGLSDLRVLNPFTGQSTLIGMTGRQRIEGLAYDDSNGNLYGLEFPSGLLRLDKQTGHATQIANLEIEAQSLELGPDGALFAGGSGPDRGLLYRVDPDTGAATLVGSTGLSDITGLMVADLSTLECQPFVRQGEQVLTINGASCGTPPTANIDGGDDAQECTSPEGAMLRLDATASTDPDEDIASYDWFEDFGEPQQALLGSGSMLDVSLAVGSHAITLRVTDGQGGQDTETVVRDVVDTTPPTLTLASSLTQLWPPNHRMIDIVAEVTAHDVCGPASIVLQSVTSSEPDDAPGPDDGHTAGDIQGASVGTADLALALRAERRGTGQGRTYTIVYGALDGGGNARQATTTVVVPHHLGGSTDPVKLALGKTVKGTTIQWPAVPGAQHYNVVRTDAAGVRLEGNVIRVGPVTCLASGVTEPVVADPTTPVPGRGFVYLVEYVQDGWPSSYGAESAGRERVVTAGGCP